MKVLIAGYYGFRNTGDELILSKIIEDLKSLNSNIEILVWSGDVEYTRKIHGVEAINRFSPSDTEEAVRWCDVAIVGGGGLIHEYFNLDMKDVFKNFGYGVAAYSIVPLLSNIYGKPIFYWSHGVGPIFSEKGKSFCKWFYSLADYTTVRDEYSYNLVKSIYPDIKKISLDVDPCVAIDVNKILLKNRFDLDKNRVKLGINIRPWFGIEKSVEKLGLALNKIIKKRKDILIVPIPFDLNLDVNILEKLLSLIPEENVEKRFFKELKSPFEVVSLVNEVDLFIGMRLHSILMAHLLRKPSLALVYDKKVESAAKKLGILDIYVGSLDILELLESFESLLQQKCLKEHLSFQYKTPEIFYNFVDGRKTEFNNDRTNSVAFDAQSFYESHIQSLKVEVEEKNKLKQELSNLKSEQEKLLKEKENLFSKLQKSYDDYKNLEAVKNQIENSLKHTQNELERILKERNEFFNALNNIYNSDFWKVASFYYKLKEKSFVLRTFVKALGKVKRLAVRLSNNKKNENNLDKPVPQKEFLEFYSKLKLPLNKNKFDIFFFSIIDWDFRFQRPQHIASRLAKEGHRIFYLKVSMGGKDYQIKEIRENIYELKLPFHKKTAVYTEDFGSGKETVLDAFRSVIRDYSVKEFVSFVEFPMWYEIVKGLKETYKTPVIFDMLDEFSGFDNVHEKVVEYEKNMIELSDSILTSSDSLFRKAKEYLDKNKMKKGCYLVRNGAEFEHFSNIKENNILSHIKKPIIGYYGAISNWFDADLIEYAAKEHPEWSFVLIGHTFGADVKKLKKLKNVHFLGEKPYGELPKYLYWFDVCLIPFKNVPLIKSTNPVKFYEYISSGKPVVATDMDELKRYDDLVYIAKDREEFVRKIEEALGENDKSIVEKRKSVAKENDWDVRVSEVKNIMENSFKKVNIVIVTYNNLDYTKLCIRSILDKTAYPNYEIIVVDNDSTDGTKDYLKSIEGNNIKVVLNDENLGFAKANNIGIRLSEGEYVILLNNDTIVTRGWIMGLLRHFKGSVGMVGPVTNSIGNEAKINVEYDNLNEMDAFAEYYTNKHFGDEFEIDVLAMFCVAVKREVINRVGLLDERYKVGMFEDDDYAIAVKRAGYKIICAEDVFIHHFGGATFKKYMNSEYREIFDENRKRFEEKWNVKWKPHKYREGVS